MSDQALAPTGEGQPTCAEGAEEGEAVGAGQRQRAPCQRPAGGEDATTKPADNDKAVSSEVSVERHLQRSTRSLLAFQKILRTLK